MFRHSSWPPPFEAPDDRSVLPIPLLLRKLTRRGAGIAALAPFRKEQRGSGAVAAGKNRKGAGAPEEKAARRRSVRPARVKKERKEEKKEKEKEVEESEEKRPASGKWSKLEAEVLAVPGGGAASVEGKKEKEGDASEQFQLGSRSQDYQVKTAVLCIKPDGTFHIRVTGELLPRQRGILFAVDDLLTGLSSILDRATGQPTVLVDHTVLPPLSI